MKCKGNEKYPNNATTEGTVDYLEQVYIRRGYGKQKNSK